MSQQAQSEWQAQVDSALYHHQNLIAQTQETLKQLGKYKMNILQGASELTREGQPVKPGHQRSWCNAGPVFTGIESFNNLYEIVPRLKSLLDTEIEVLQSLQLDEEARQAQYMGHRLVDTADRWASHPCDHDADLQIQSLTEYGQNPYKDEERGQREAKQYLQEANDVENTMTTFGLKHRTTEIDWRPYDARPRWN